MQGTALDALSALVGRWRGTVRTWLDPAAPPVVNDITGAFRNALDGATLLHEYQSHVGDKRADGLMVIGWDIATNESAMLWIDTFHTGSNVMMFAPETKSAGSPVRLIGAYAAGDETWRWRVTFTVVSSDECRIEHVNISPAGGEDAAIEMTMRRENDAADR